MTTGFRRILRGAGKRPKAAVAAFKVSHCLRQIVTGKIRPLALRKDELRIRAFPQQEIAQPLFAARANQEIDIRTKRQAQMLPRDSASRTIGSLKQSAARGIVQRQTQMQLLSVTRLPLR